MTSLAALALAIGLVIVVPWCQAEDAPLRHQTDFAQQLESLAKKCDELKLADQAAITRRWIIPRHSGRQYFFVPETTDSTAPAKNAPQVVQQWHAKFLELRREQAARLLEQAESELAADQPVRAYRLLFEVLHEDPDHAEARRILGYEKLRSGEWASPYGKGASVATFDHPRFGWRRRTYWRLETEHYSIQTNHSAKEALELARHLEDLHAIWRQAFFSYWTNADALKHRMDGGSEPLSRKEAKLRVVLFKNRQEYAGQLAEAEPKIGLTTGIYRASDQTAYFYGGDTSVIPTWYHEGTHQLFQEMDRFPAEPGQERNFWIIEGVALWMESLARHEGYWTIGGFDADRLQFARYRVLSGDFEMPLAKLVTLGRDEVQQAADIRKLYAHAAGVTHFLMEADAGKRAEATTRYLRTVYEQTDKTDTLFSLAGADGPALDLDYKEFLHVADVDLATIIDPLRIRNLSLGRTAVTDAGMKHLAGCTNLAWLDLSLTRAGDEGLASIKDCRQLKQLFLEGTKITDASLPLIGGLKELEELDLSAVRVSDEALAALANLKKLKVLYLTNSPVSDQCLTHLKGLKLLETLETSGTKITPAGRKNLKLSLPKLASP
ncbi:MAG TPA: DUF1570 domain-containing protein [Pirellulaceae bacterium]|nr:DUF1570 domain-containing protein [Pirellulaceae bacterium]